ncbi:HTTM domain-containing protein [Chitinophaga barathri]|uniref:HTTM domain-containing protein n=1 Tax=Chitinophaga barathri TaxID=1647451 RepID=A0A3N4MGM4_9BACT|nr:HTTM domain-containing protein [Chitinophaga barathri]RPD41166.1 HTTM domain-containing protein [Chitinophaga barathri]
MTATNTGRFTKPVSIAPLVTFRITFGLLMFVSLLRFWWRGWVTDVYVLPKFHFAYQGFEWVQPLGHTGMHALFFTVLAAALFIAAGFLYRWAAVVFFLGFTYIELIDVTTYLNHYYFISLVAFIMIWLPANRRYSVDVWLKPEKERTQLPAWCIQVLIFQISVVYVFAGLAKINSDWLLEAQPMRTWLPAKTHLPLVGRFMYEPWTAYLFSWFGAVYDLFIVFFLLNKRTRPYAYAVVLVFHIATAIFFPGIGMFPYVMMTASLLFFSADFHERLLGYLPGYSPKKRTGDKVYNYSGQQIFLAAFGIYVILQVIIPLRFLLYPGHLFWHEEGYRFSWRVMLMEKAGTAYFTVKDQAHREVYTVNNAEFLTPLQEKMMSTQPDLILKYAHYLASEYGKRGVNHPEVYGEIYVALNGQRSRLFVDTLVNLAAQPLGWGHYQWVLPYKNSTNQQ